MREEKLPVSTEFIKLEAAMKFAGITQTGGEAKEYILNGEVQVNGEICYQRGKKLYPGDRFTFRDTCHQVTHHEA